jgi:transcriptional regulator with GAF, ATPase, and Fis domain
MVSCGHHGGPAVSRELLLLLDEIGELPPSLQVKLRRALQEHQIRRVGDTRHRAFDARVIAATNRNLALDLKDGRFRLDLTTGLTSWSWRSRRSGIAQRICANSRP